MAATGSITTMAAASSEPIGPESTTQPSSSSSLSRSALPAPPYPPSLPIPIFRVSASRPRYLLYDAATVAWARRELRILGVLVGGLAQFPQQNVFFGLPLELMVEEARLLVDGGHAFVVDDLEAHRDFVAALARREHAAVSAARRQSADIARVAAEAQDAAVKARLEELERFKLKRGLKVKKQIPMPSMLAWNAAKLPLFDSMGENESKEYETEMLLFEPGTSSQKRPKETEEDEMKTAPWFATLATTSSLFGPTELPRSTRPIEVSSSRYALYKHLNSKGYYMSPGLRFGCQFTAYPGDPLRYHSHFLATSAEWEEEFDLLEIIGGGRLGTGVKKGYLIGGEQTEGARKGDIRTFCIEWGGL